MKKKVVALIGNPNSGKTTIFNGLTGSTQQTGNWPGVTVEKKTGSLLDYPEVEVVDLPGIYSLGAYSEDELVARGFIMNERPDVIIDVIDASNLKRNLYLAVQLLEMGENLIFAVNMLDEAKKNNADVDVAALKDILGVPAIPTVAIKNVGLRELAQLAEESTATDNKYLKIDYGNEIESHIQKIAARLAEKGIQYKGLPLRSLAIKLLEGNEEIISELSKLGLDKKDEEDLRKDRNHLRNIFNEDIESVIIEKRYGFIEAIVKKVVKRSNTLEERINISDKIDKIVLNKYLSIPIFLMVMFLMFQITFTIGGLMIGWIETLFNNLATFVSAIVANELLDSFLVKGIIGGVGSILVFIPNIFLLFFVLSFLEDSGYMARGAYIMDRLMRSLGLQGKSFIPLVTGFGCSVPAVMSTRTLESKEDRMITMLVVPFMSCGARLPIYVLFAGAFFPGKESLVIISLYILGIVLAVIMAKIFRKFLFKGKTTPFVMELPPYRIPTLRGMFIHMWDRGGEFLKKAGTIIFAAVILIWALASLPWGVDYASNASLIGKIGGILAVIFKPLGFGTWEAATALLFGVVSKEVVVATLGTVYTGGGGLSAALSSAWTPLSAYAFMVMSLLYTPCIPTLGAIRRESNSWRWMVFSILYTFGLAWLISFIVYQIGILLGLGV